MNSYAGRQQLNVVILGDSADVTTANLPPALRHAGYLVHFVTLDTAAVRIGRLKPCAVLFNVGRLSKNSYTLLGALRKREDLKNVVMIGILGENEGGSAPELKDFDYCFDQPVNERSLLAAIRQRANRVLLVEDHAPLAEVTAELMRSVGLEVQIAATGRAALEMAESFQPEIVLCDMRLPDMTGFDVARALRKRPGMSHALIAMHTALAEADLRMFERQEDSPVKLFLSKPLTVEKLEALISELEVLQLGKAV